MIKFLKNFWPFILLVFCVVLGILSSSSMKKELEEAKKPMEKKPEKVHVHKFVPNGEWTVQRQRTLDVQRKESFRISDGLKSVEDTMILEVMWRRETICSCGQTFHEHQYSTNSIPFSRTVPKDYDVGEPVVEILHPNQGSSNLLKASPSLQTIPDPKFKDDPSTWVDRTR